jgi:hypothetical protein
MPRMRASGDSVRSSVTSAVHRQTRRAEPGVAERGAGELAAREREHQRGRRQRAAECRTLDQRTANAEQHCGQGTDRGAAGGAHHVGIGQRVAQQHLHPGAGHREQAAGGERGQRARQPQLVHDLRGDAAIGHEHRAQQLDRCDRAAADGQCDRQRHEGQQRQHEPDAQRAGHRSTTGC